MFLRAKIVVFSLIGKINKLGFYVFLWYDEIKHRAPAHHTIKIWVENPVAVKWLAEFLGNQLIT